MELTRKQIISNLSSIMDSMPDDACGDWRDSLAFAIKSIKVDEAYQIMYEGGSIFNKADVAVILKELEYDLYHALCHEIHGKEDCPCTNQTTSCLATFRVCDADRAIGRVIQQKIDRLKENT